jgi:hypothetical protein
MRRGDSAEERSKPHLRRLEFVQVLHTPKRNPTPPLSNKSDRTHVSAVGFRSHAGASRILTGSPNISTASAEGRSLTSHRLRHRLIEKIGPAATGPNAIIRHAVFTQTPRQRPPLPPPPNVHAPCTCACRPGPGPAAARPSTGSDYPATTTNINTNPPVSLLCLCLSVCLSVYLSLSLDQLSLPSRVLVLQYPSPHQYAEMKLQSSSDS